VECFALNNAGLFIILSLNAKMTLLDECGEDATEALPSEQPWLRSYARGPGFSGTRLIDIIRSTALAEGCGHLQSTVMTGEIGCRETP
jgi:hypothetical protein